MWLLTSWSPRGLLVTCGMASREGLGSRRGVQFQKRQVFILREGTKQWGGRAPEILPPARTVYFSFPRENLNFIEEEC